jgi:hypothetical protein
VFPGRKDTGRSALLRSICAIRGARAFNVAWVCDSSKRSGPLIVQHVVILMSYRPKPRGTARDRSEGTNTCSDPGVGTCASTTGRTSAGCCRASTRRWQGLRIVASDVTR